MLRVFVVSLFAAAAIPLIAAQDQSFEVASVKRNDSGQNGGMMRMLPGGRMNAVNFPVRQMIIYGWQLSAPQIIGGPAWINTDGYDVIAKIDGNAKPVAPGTGQVDPLQMAMRNLLADRFKMKSHLEMREMDVYALVLARPGGHGPKLIQSPQDCAAQAAAARGAPPPPPGPLPELGKPYCGIASGGGRIRFGGLNSTMIAQSFNPWAGRIVVDRTGLEGSWDFELRFTPPQRGAGPDAGAAGSDLPDFFTAVQEQLGLKLEASKAPIQVLVIDSIERPTED